MRFIRRWNDALATWLVLAMGTVWCVYVFVLWSVLPMIFPETHTLVFGISIIIQLAAFPVVLLGQRLLGRQLERRMSTLATGVTPVVVETQVVDLSGIEQRLDVIEQRIGKLRAAPSRKPRQRVKKLPRPGGPERRTRSLYPD